MEAVHKRFEPNHFKRLKFHAVLLASSEISITSSKPNVKAPAYCRDVDILFLVLSIRRGGSLRPPNLGAHSGAPLRSFAKGQNPICNLDFGFHLNFGF